MAISDSGDVEVLMRQEDVLTAVEDMRMLGSLHWSQGYRTQTVKTSGI